MSKLFMLLLGMSILFNYSNAQTHYKLNGSIVDENNEPLTGASVFLQSVNKGTITNANGNFVIDNLPKGKYIITVSFVGYKTLIDTIFFDGIKSYKFQ
jgi:iron complex outermembrane receptor protein